MPSSKPTDCRRQAFQADGSWRCFALAHDGRSLRRQAFRRSAPAVGYGGCVVARALLLHITDRRGIVAWGHHPEWRSPASRGAFPSRRSPRFPRYAGDGLSTHPRGDSAPSNVPNARADRRRGRRVKNAASAQELAAAPADRGGSTSAERPCRLRQSRSGRNPRPPGPSARTPATPVRTTLPVLRRSWKSAPSEP